MLLLLAAELLIFGTAAILPTVKDLVGVGTKAPKGADQLIDGTRKNAGRRSGPTGKDPRLAATLPIKWFLVKDPAGSGMALNTNDPAGAGGEVRRG